MVKSQYISPEMTVTFTWKQTIQLSSNKTALATSQTLQNLDDIKEEAYKDKDKREKIYFNGICSAIDATFRNLITIMNGRELNFSEIEKLRQNKRENIHHIETFSGNIQSIIPRLTSMSIGGVSITLLLNKLSQPIVRARACVCMKMSTLGI